VVLFLFSHPTEWQGFKAAASPFFFFLCGTTVIKIFFDQGRGWNFA
jgi:hypothetical protein